MRFLVISRPKHPMPLDISVTVLDGLLEWFHKYESKIEVSWASAGVRAGGFIANVESAEDLDAMMDEHPAGPFQEFEITLMVDMKTRLQRAREIARARLAAMSG